MEEWQDLTRTHFDINKKLLDIKYEQQNNNKNNNNDNKKKIVIKLPNKFTIQQFFDNNCNKKDSTFLFRDFIYRGNQEKSTREYYYSDKLFLDWDVKYDG